MIPSTTALFSMAYREIPFTLYHITILLSELYNSRMPRSLINIFQKLGQRFFIALCFPFNLQITPLTKRTFKITEYC